MVKSKKRDDKMTRKKFKLSQMPWEFIVLAVLLIILGYIFSDLGRAIRMGGWQ